MSQLTKNFQQPIYMDPAYRARMMPIFEQLARPVIEYCRLLRTIPATPEGFRWGYTVTRDVPHTTLRIACGIEREDGSNLGVVEYLMRIHERTGVTHPMFAEEFLRDLDVYLNGLEGPNVNRLREYKDTDPAIKAAAENIKKFKRPGMPLIQNLPPRRPPPAQQEFHFVPEQAIEVR